MHVVCAVFARPFSLPTIHASTAAVHSALTESHEDARRRSLAGAKHTDEIPSVGGSLSWISLVPDAAMNALRLLSLGLSLFPPVFDSLDAQKKSCFRFVPINPAVVEPFEAGGACMRGAIRRDGGCR